MPPHAYALLILIFHLLLPWVLLKLKSFAKAIIGFGATPHYIGLRSNISIQPGWISIKLTRSRHDDGPSYSVPRPLNLPQKPEQGKSAFVQIRFRILFLLSVDIVVEQVLSHLSRWTSLIPAKCDFSSKDEEVSPSRFY